MRASCPMLLPTAPLPPPRYRGGSQPEAKKERETRRHTFSVVRSWNRFAQLQGRNDFSRVPSVRANSIFRPWFRLSMCFIRSPFHFILPPLSLFLLFLLVSSILFLFFSFEIRKSKSSISISSWILISSNEILFRSTLVPSSTVSILETLPFHPGDDAGISSLLPIRFGYVTSKRG